MIAVAAAWPEIIAAVEASALEVAGWITAASPLVRTVELDADGVWRDLAMIALARSPSAPLALFHSHPEGRATLSLMDLAQWAPTGVPRWPWPQLVVATRSQRAIAAVLFVWDVGTSRPRCPAQVVRTRDGAWRAR